MVGNTSVDNEMSMVITRISKYVGLEVVWFALKVCQRLSHLMFGKFDYVSLLFGL